MVNFRFHLISLIAVFLALGLGILMGSTVVDQAIVDRLDREIDETREEARRLGDANDALRTEIERADATIEDLAPFAVEGRLEGVPVAVFVESGLDGDVVGATVDALDASGAEATVMRLTERWLLDDTDDVAALRGAVDGTGGPEALRSQALAAIAGRLIEPPAPAEGEEVDDPLARLADADFLELPGDLDLASFPARPARALIVTGSESDLVDTPTTIVLARSLVGADVAGVAGEVHVDSDTPDAPARGAAVNAIREDDVLSDTVSTVDDLDEVTGRVAAVLALEDLVTGRVGHYGHGDGADQQLPEAQP